VPDSSSPAVVVAEYVTRFEADVSVACLADQGIEALVRADPAHAVAPNLVTMPGFRVEVHRDDFELARAALGLDQPRDLEAERLDREFFHISFSERPRWVRWLAVMGIVSVAGPAALVATLLVILTLTQLAPG
jgi:hypothetical protein